MGVEWVAEVGGSGGGGGAGVGGGGGVSGGGGVDCLVGNTIWPLAALGGGFWDNL